jgi:radical SAM superfamily enzyme YgiQ (UPF0313 family)
MKLLLLNPVTPFSLLSIPIACQMLGLKAFSPPLGLATVAALMPSTWEMRLVDLNCADVSDADWQWAETVLISGMFLQSNSLLQLVREAKKRGKFVVCGGPYVSSVPEPAMEAGSDVVVRGEAENVVNDIVTAITEARSGLVIEGSDKPDITNSPVPRFDLFDRSNYLAMAVQTSRGCPFECEFCDVINLYGRKMRYKSPEQVTAELEALRVLGWTGLVFLSDDNFIGSKKYARSILQGIVVWNKSHGEPFSFLTQASLNLAAHTDLIDLMTEANFGYVFIGIESPDESVLKLNRKTQNIENPIVESLRTFNARGLPVIASFVIGFDSEKKGVDERISALLEASGTGLAFIHMLQAMPNTKLWDRLEKEGRLLPGVTSGDSLTSKINFTPSRPEEEIMREWAGTWNLLYEPSTFLDRILRGFLAMRPTRRALGIDTSPEQVSHVMGAPPKLGTKMSEKLINAFKFIRLAGMRPPTVLKFLKHIMIMWRKNPSRLMQYLVSCEFGANMFWLRNEVRKRSAISAPELSEPQEHLVP